MKKLLKWWTDTSLVARILAGVVIGAVFFTATAEMKDRKQK